MDRRSDHTAETRAAQLLAEAVTRAAAAGWRTRVLDSTMGRGPEPLSSKRQPS